MGLITWILGYREFITIDALPRGEIKARLYNSETGHTMYRTVIIHEDSHFLKWREVRMDGKSVTSIGYKVTHWKK